MVEYLRYLYLVASVANARPEGPENHLMSRPRETQSQRKSALVLVTSPLHATLALRLLEAETITDYDVVYLSSADSPADRTYYDRVSRSSSASHYFYIRQDSSITQILLSLWKIQRARLRRRYDFAVFGTLTSLPIRRTATKHAPAFLTFDEGMSNLNSESRQFNESSAWNARLYRAILAPSLNFMKEKIVHHYSVHPELKNIVNDDKILALEGWRSPYPDQPAARPRAYFIGTEIDKFFSPNLDRLPGILAAYHIDCYVAHPREKDPLDLGVPLLNKRGLMAEEAILEDAAGRPIHLIGWPSTVFFNLRLAHRRTIIFPKNPRSLAPLVDLAESLGCEIAYI